MESFIHRSGRWMATYRMAKGPKFKGLFLQCQGVLDHIQIIYNISRDQCPICFAIDYGKQCLMSQLHIRGLSSIKLISCIASGSEDIIEQMNEGGGLIPSRETRKRRRRSRFRYSSKKDLERSKPEHQSLLPLQRLYPIPEHSQVVVFLDQVVHSALRELRNKMVTRWI
jgi:hypothetical protein